MKNIELKQGICPFCKRKVSKGFAGKNPPLGTSCEQCAYTKKNTIFTGDHFDFEVKESDTHSVQDRFDFSGTRIMVNGKVGVIMLYQGGTSYVQFEGEKGTTSVAIGFWAMLKIYSEK